LVVMLMTPMTAACQRGQADRDAGIEELRELVRNSSDRPAVADLTRIESRYSRTRSAALARFLRGYLYFSAQNYAAATEALDSRAIGATTALGDYSLFYRAESEAASDAKSEARRDYRSLVEKYPDSLKAHEAKLRAAEMAVSVGDPGNAIKELARLVESNDANAIYVTALGYEAMGKTDDALKLYKRIYYELPATSASVKAEARLVALNAPPRDAGSFAEERSRADALFEAKQHGESAGAYQQLLLRFPEADRIDEVHLRYGVSLSNKQPAQAVSELARVSDRNPDMRAEALFYQAEALRG